MQLRITLRRLVLRLKAYEDDDDNAKAELFKGELKNFIGAIALAGGRIN